MQNEILALIDHVQEQTELADMAVMSSLLQTYTKSILMAEQCVDSDVSAVFQEAFDYSAPVDNSGFETIKGRAAKQPSKMEKFKRDLNAPVLGNKDESMAKRILMVIPRLIKKLIEMLKKLINRTKTNANKYTQIADECLKAYNSLSREQKTEFEDKTYELTLYYFGRKRMHDDDQDYMKIFAQTMDKVRETLTKSGIYKFVEDKYWGGKIPFEDIKAIISKLTRNVAGPEHPGVAAEYVKRQCREHFAIDLDELDLPITRKEIYNNGHYQPKQKSIKGTELLELFRMIKNDGSKIYKELTDMALAISGFLRQTESNLEELAADTSEDAVKESVVVWWMNHVQSLSMTLCQFQVIIGYITEYDEHEMYEATKQSFGSMHVSFGIKRLDKFVKQSERETPSERATNKGL